MLSEQFHIDLIATCWDTSLIRRTVREQDGGGRYVASGTKQNPTKQIDYSVRCESDPDTFTAVQSHG